MGKEYLVEGARLQCVQCKRGGIILPLTSGQDGHPGRFRAEQEEGLGRVYLVRTNQGKGIYFCVTSFLDTSSGYVYLTDNLPEDSKYMVDRVVLFEEYDTNWYRCSTDY